MGNIGKRTGQILGQISMKVQGLTCVGPYSPEEYLTAGHQAAAGMSPMAGAGSSYTMKETEGY